MKNFIGSLPKSYTDFPVIQKNWAPDNKVGSETINLM